VVTALSISANAGLLLKIASLSFFNNLLAPVPLFPPFLFNFFSLSFLFSNPSPQYSLLGTVIVFFQPGFGVCFIYKNNISFNL